MRISERWLREWIDPPSSTTELAGILTMAGLEVDSLEPAAPPFTGVVVAEIEACRPHPEADRLQICRVNDGAAATEIVCGAPNARPGLRAPLARPGAALPHGRTVDAAEIRGVPSAGMLCSAAELGLAEDSDGLLELAPDLPLGADLRTALELDDTVIEIDLTPNRADCLSVIGVAREVAAGTGAGALTTPAVPPVAATHDEQITVHLDAPTECPRYCGRVIRGVDTAAPTPMWMRERLRRAGLRSVSAVVDVTNYVLLEYGHPLHAFDLEKLHGPIRVRLAAPKERLTLLGGEEMELDDDVLVIADATGPIAMAGVMGGERTAVDTQTRDIFLESAFFAPQRIIGRARRYGLHTDASHRFERGVDPDGAARASERATALILELCGGEPGPLVESLEPDHLPDRSPVALRRDRLASILGWRLDDAVIEGSLSALGMAPERRDDGWLAQPPGWRFDIEREEDLIEEVARLAGYDAVPEHRLPVPMTLPRLPETRVSRSAVTDTLVERGYFEAITYSFVDPELQRRLLPKAEAIPLANPLSSEMAVMRASLWPGLVAAARHNHHRQHGRVRLFEMGRIFQGSLDDLAQPLAVAGLAMGPVLPEQWATATPEVDFFDVKEDVTALLARANEPDSFAFEPATHPALHPGQSARLLRHGAPIGWLGRLHPAHAQALDLPDATVLFELSLESLAAAKLPIFSPLSRFPSIRRDLAFVVDETVAGGDLRAAAKEAAGSTVIEVRLFDVYYGKGVPEGQKSIAMGLILQDYYRTLTDRDVDDVVDRVVRRLEGAFGATLRG